mmetsp:Transcript_8757/g.12043  ORF Transcript_8757/g.12043 Transcript_8757/m.12043 type:complete len:182 (-) Transcript_8757:92-637(-)
MRMEPSLDVPILQTNEKGERLTSGTSKHSDRKAGNNQKKGVYGFAKEDMTDLQACFKMFDKDSDGRISSTELKDVFKTIGLEPTAEDLKNMMLEADVQDDELDFEHFVKMMASQMENSDSIINCYDEDFISVPELKHVMLALGEDLSDNDLEAMIEEADINGDGKLNYKEFVAMIMQSGGV